MKCTTADYKPGFPSGHRGWTQDPLRKASQVRILPPALSEKTTCCEAFDTTLSSIHIDPRRCVTCAIVVDESILESSNKIHFITAIITETIWTLVP